MGGEASPEALYLAARSAWPSVDVAPELFASWIAERAPSDETVGDLYLACACAHGDKTALSIFESRFAPEIRGALVRMKQPDATVEEVVQLVREKLFVGGDDGRAPRIADYSGRGDLRSWLRVIAVRTALSWLRRENKAIVTHEAELPDVAAPADPELDHMRTLYAAEFRESLEHAIMSLTVKDRGLLKQHFLDGLGVEELARVHRVHTATAARWLARARERVEAATKAEMMRRLQLRRDDVSAIVELIRSRLDVSITRLLAVRR